jgi:integrase
LQSATEAFRVGVEVVNASAHGLREIIGLKWSDFDRSASRLSISRTLQNVGGRPTEFGVKTRTSRRTVDLDHHTVRHLDR